MVEQQTSETQQESLLKQYKLYVEMTDRLTARRSDTNKFYLTLLTGLFAVVSFVVEKSGLQIAEKNLVLVGIGLLGIVLCVIWFSNIRSYRLINSCKFQVINEMEKDLPFPSYTREWKLLTGEDKHRYLQFTAIERVVPFAIAILYLALTIFAVLGLK